MNEPRIAYCEARPAAAGGAQSPPSAIGSARPGHHFFGYYDLCPWDATGRYLLLGQTSLYHQRPTAADPLAIGMADLSEGGRVIDLAATHAWDWQMSCRVQWLPGAAGGRIIYNDRRDGRIVSVIRAIAGDEEQVLPMPIFSLTPDGRTAVTLDFHRLHVRRLGYGIPDAGDHALAEPAPPDQGLYTMDLATGQHRLAVSLKRLAELDPIRQMADARHWVNHLLINPGGTRVAFVHRWQRAAEEGWTTRLMTADLDGGDLFILNPAPMTSHFDWLDDARLLAWAERDGRRGYFLLTDRTDRAELIGAEWFDSDGHCSFSPDRRWMLTDSYPREEPYRTLILYRWPDGPRIDIGRFYSPPEVTGPNRCDLHPRWSRDGRAVCIDSAHEGRRGVYILEVSDIVGGR